MTTNVQLVDELREVADWFRLRGLDENAALLDHAAYVVQCAANFFAWYNKYYPEPSSHPHHPWCVLGVSLALRENDSALATQAQPKRRPYNASASLSEYGIFPECDAVPAAQSAEGGEVCNVKSSAEMASMGLEVREWTCPGCGENYDRDLNAAKKYLASRSKRPV